MIKAGYLRVENKEEFYYIYLGSNDNYLIATDNLDELNLNKKERRELMQNGEIIIRNKRKIDKITKNSIFL